MTKPKDKTAAASKPEAAKKDAAPKTATAKAAAAPKVTETPTTAPAPEATAAPKAAPAPESAKTEPEAAKAEAPKADEATVSGGLGDLLGLLTGGEPVDLSQIFKVLSGPAEEKDDSTEDSKEEGFAEEILTRVLGMAAHPVFGIGVVPEKAPDAGFGFADLFAGAFPFAGSEFDEQNDFFGGCCAGDDPFGPEFPAEQEPLVIFERDEETRSMGHIVDLKKLYDAGILTEAEFTSKKQDILRSLYR